MALTLNRPDLQDAAAQASSSAQLPSARWMFEKPQDYQFEPGPGDPDDLDGGSSDGGLPCDSREGPEDREAATAPSPAAEDAAVKVPLVTPGSKTVSPVTAPPAVLSRAMTGSDPYQSTTGEGSPKVARVAWLCCFRGNITAMVALLGGVAASLGGDVAVEGKSPAPPEALP